MAILVMTHCIVSCASVGIAALVISWDLQIALIFYIRMGQLKGVSVEVTTTDAVEWRVNIVLCLSS